MKNNDISRRKFLRRSATVTGLGLMGVPAVSCGSDSVSTRERELLRRGVKVASVDLQHLYPEDSIESRVNNIFSRMEKAAGYKPDIICLPETFNTSYVSEDRSYPEIAEPETGGGPLTTRIADFAKKNKCYVIAPVVTSNEGRFYNSAVLVDRLGDISGIYHKAHPVDTEIKNGDGIIPGPIRPPVFDTDFGKIGVQICFDANWFISWALMKEDGAEIVFFPSQYPGGRMLNFLAWKNNYYIVSSTGEDARILDISGIDIDSSSFQLGYTWASLNLEKAYVPTFPGKYHIPDIYKKYGDKVKIQVYRDSAGGAGTGAGHITIESLDPELFVRDILNEYNIPTYREDLNLSEEIQKKNRISRS